jgi:hypothetical protein
MPPVRIVKTIDFIKGLKPVAYNILRHCGVEIAKRDFIPRYVPV